MRRLGQVAFVALAVSTFMPSHARPWHPNHPCPCLA
jgi:hypothetical protein